MVEAASRSNAPVLIVGAGPTGLAAAMSLVRARVPVRLIDKAPQPAAHSRAIGIQARTLELFEQHRIVEPFLDLGHRARVANLHSNGQLLAQLDFDPLQTRYPYLLFLDQSVTERLLTGHLASLGVVVERGTELTAFSDAAAGLEATLRHTDGREETLRPAWLIAADGAHSTVRHQLGMRFAGKTFEQTFVLADLHIDVDWPEDELHIFASGNGLAALFPFGGGAYRLIADLPVAPESPEKTADAPAAGTQEDAPTLADCHALVEERLHQSLRLSAPTWSARFRVNSRMVERLRAGRVLLAGDAAHVHSPAGAQGMNTGIQEAFNLGWKLARVVNGGAPDRLLDTYHVERHPIERVVLRQTAFVTQMAEASHGPLKLVRDHVMPVLATLGPLRDAARRTISELSIQYRRSPLTLERVLDGGPRAGERAPDALVHVIDGPLGRAPGVGCLFDLHDPGFFSLFLLIDAQAQDQTPALAAALPASADGEGREGGEGHEAYREELLRLSAAMERLLPGAVRIWQVTDTPGSGAPSLAEAYGRVRPAFYLLRPDGYIGARGRLMSDLNTLLHHCETWFAKENVPPAGLPPSI